MVSSGSGATPAHSAGAGVTVSPVKEPVTRILSPSSTDLSRAPKRPAPGPVAVSDTEPLSLRNPRIEVSAN
jgi:hypothetical protein